MTKFAEINPQNVASILKINQHPMSLVFIAMEYYAVILNRTFLIFTYHEVLCGAKLRSLTSSFSVLAGEDRWANLYSYLSRGFLKKHRGISPDSPAFLIADRANFQIPRHEISKVVFDPTSKWGMGGIPHTGKLYIETAMKRREFIILDHQNGKEIESALSDWLH